MRIRYTVLSVPSRKTTPLNVQDALQKLFHPPPCASSKSRLSDVGAASLVIVKV